MPFPNSEDFRIVWVPARTADRRQVIYDVISAGLTLRAGEGTRTLDNQLGRLELYQLSYTRSVIVWPVSETGVVEEGGFEPPKA